MPNITITPEQAAALARGEDITVSAPKPPSEETVWNTTLICVGSNRQRYNTTVKFAEDDPRGAAQRWANTSMGVRLAVSAHGGGIIGVCKLTDVDNARYRLATMRTSYYRIDASGVVQETI